MRIAISLLLCSLGGTLLGQQPNTTPSNQGTDHVIQCPDSPTPAQRPSNMECVILIRKTLPSLPHGPVVWRLETYPSVAAATQAQSQNSVVVQAANKVWLMTLAEPGQRSTGGTFVAEVGPLPLLSAPKYEMLVAEVAATSGRSMVHTHSGPEAWYLLAGKQCVETPQGMKTAKTGEGMFEPADTPMRLTVVGNDRDSFFMVVHDPARPWNSPSDWHPTGLCELGL